MHFFNLIKLLYSVLVEIYTDAGDDGKLSSVNFNTFNWVLIAIIVLGAVLIFLLIGKLFDLLDTIIELKSQIEELRK